jgi:hypothetical protein
VGDATTTRTSPAARTDPCAPVSSVEFAGSVGARGPDLPNSLSSKRWPRRSELNARRLRRASQNDTFEDRVRVSHTCGSRARYRAPNAGRACCRERAQIALMALVMRARLADENSGQGPPCRNWASRGLRVGQHASNRRGVPANAALRGRNALGGPCIATYAFRPIQLSLHPT